MAFIGHIKDGISFIEKALHHTHKIGHVYSAGMVEFPFSTVFALIGDAKNTIEHAERAIEYFQKSKAYAFLGIQLNLLGLGYYLQGNLDTALEYAKKGYKTQNDLGISTQVSQIYLLFAVIYFSADQLNDARENIENALALSQKNNEKYIEGLAWLWQGKIFWKMGLFKEEKAEKSIRKGIKTLKNLKIKPIYSCGYLFLGELYLDSGQREKALKYLKKAEENFKDMEMDYWLKKTEDILKSI